MFIVRKLTKCALGGEGREERQFTASIQYTDWFGRQHNRYVLTEPTSAQSSKHQVSPYQYVHTVDLVLIAMFPRNSCVFCLIRTHALTSNSLEPPHDVSAGEYIQYFIERLSPRRQKGIASRGKSGLCSGWIDLQQRWPTRSAQRVKGD